MVSDTLGNTVSVDVDATTSPRGVMITVIPAGGSPDTFILANDEAHILAQAIRDNDGTALAKRLTQTISFTGTESTHDVTHHHHTSHTVTKTITSMNFVDTNSANPISVSFTPAKWSMMVQALDSAAHND
jgi:hypothetical protein